MKHAILIVTYDQPELIEKTIVLYDSIYIDFFIHVDKKSNVEDFEYLKKIARKSNIFFVPRINVKWGSHSLIEAEVLLFETSLKKEKYEYFHLISGQDLPIVSNKTFLNFFQNKTENFMRIRKITEDALLDRVKYYHPIMQINCLSRNKFGWRLDKLFVLLQKLLFVNRSKNYEYFFGSSWSSLHVDFVDYLVNYSKDKKFKKRFFWSSCADEIYKQSIFMEWRKDNKNCLLIIDNLRFLIWEKGSSSPKNLDYPDLDNLMNSSALFARKFSLKKEFTDFFVKKLKNME